MRRRNRPRACSHGGRQSAARCPATPPGAAVSIALAAWDAEAQVPEGSDPGLALGVGRTSQQRIESERALPSEPFPDSCRVRCTAYRVPWRTDPPLALLALRGFAPHRFDRSDFTVLGTRFRDDAKTIAGRPPRSSCCPTSARVPASSACRYRPPRDQPRHLGACCKSAHSGIRRLLLPSVGS